MWFSLITLACAILLSSIAAYYSVVGLIAIFAASPIPIAIMGGSLEAAKLIVVSWLYKNWNESPKLLKYYFMCATIILMIITSLGIFGYLSKAHIDQGAISSDVISKISLIDEKIKISKENIDINRKALKQLDDAVEQVMIRSKDEKGADKAVNLRKSQSKERASLISEIEMEQKKINQLNEEAAPIRGEVRKVEAEVGPLKYIAEIIYGEDAEDHLSSAVKFVIILLVLVFDPLAVLLVIAANYSLNQYVKKQPHVIDAAGFEPVPMTKNELDNITS